MPVRRRVEAREREQVVGQPRHPVDRPLDHRGRPCPALGGRLGVRQRELEVRLDRRERRAELVRGVGDEAALRGEGEVEPREHGVEGVGEPLQLVVRAAELDPPRELPRLDLARHVGDVRDRREHPARDHPSHRQARDEERAERAEREVAQVAQGALVDLLLEGLRVDERPLLELAAVVHRHLLDDDRLRDRLVAEAERETEVEPGDEECGDEEEDARVEQRQAHAYGAHELTHASSLSRYPTPWTVSIGSPASLRRSVITVTRTVRVSGFAFSSHTCVSRSNSESASPGRDMK